MNVPNQLQLHFMTKVRDVFSFLYGDGFVEVEVLPTLVRYRKGDVEVDIYHGRQSYEIGGGVSFSGVRYAMSELLRASDPEAAMVYRNPLAATLDGISAGLDELSELMQRYGAAALRGDARYFSALESQRKRWAEEYALDVIEAQVRPQAEEAFRRGDYPKAIESYGRIRKRLSPVELKKLAFAEERCDLRKKN